MKDTLEGENLRKVLFYSILGIFIIICFLMILPFLKILGWAIAVAIIFYPIYSKLNKRVKNQNICAFISCAIIVLLILIPSIFLISGIVHQGNELSKTVHRYIQEGKLEEFNPLKIDIINRGWSILSKNLNISEADIQATLSKNLEKLGAYIGRYGVIIFKNVALLIVQIALVFVLLFFMLRDSKKIPIFIKPFIPLSEKDAEMVLNRISETIRATVNGWIVVGLIQGTLLGIAFFILGLPSPLFWGACAVILCFIPYVGTPVIWIPTVVILFIQEMYWKAIFLALWAIILISFVDNFLRPILVGARLKLHPMIIFFAIFGGLFLLGPLGLLIGPVIIATTITLLDTIKDKFKQEMPTEEIVEIPKDEE